MPSIDPAIRKRLISTYKKNLSDFSRVLYYCGVFNVVIKSLPIGYKIGSRLRPYHPISWIFTVITIVIFTLVGLLHGVKEIVNWFTRFNYTDVIEPKEKFLKKE